MTTARQIRGLLQPLARRQSDVAFIGAYAVLKPLRHIIRGIGIERSAEAHYFYPVWSVMHLCQPLRRFPTTWSERIQHHETYSWRWDDPLVPADFYAVIEGQTLPFLRAIQTIDDFVAVAGKERFPLSSLDGFPYRKIVVDVARGDLASARERCATLQAWLTREMDSDFRWVITMIVDALCPLLADDDRKGLARQLGKWEAYTARNLRIEEIWEPTPFPLELQMKRDPAR